MPEGQLTNERVVYLNGKYVPESQATVHVSDRGFIFGDAVFDTARTFNGNIYRLKDHLERLMRSLRYLRIDPGLTLDQFAEISEEVVARNRHLLGPDDDYWIFQRVTRGSAFGLRAGRSYRRHGHRALRAAASGHPCAAVPGRDRGGDPHHPPRRA